MLFVVEIRRENTLFTAILFKLISYGTKYELCEYGKNINGGDIMTNINCTSNCIYQKDGKCHLCNVTTVSNSLNNSCVYFVDKNEKPKEET